MAGVIKNISDVARWRLCLGCGICAAYCTNGAVEMVNDYEQGIRPVFDETKCKNCGQCVQLCPGMNVKSETVCGGKDGFAEEWGTVLGMWRGYSSDREIRFRGSSGGIATATAVYCLEKGFVSGVLHIGPSQDNPLENTAVFSRTAEEVLNNSGSRYAPAAPLTGLGIVEEVDKPIILIGKPCDIAGLRNAERLYPELAKKIFLTISIFCAGTPSTNGTIDLIRAVGADPEDVVDIRYRGNGWPGMATVRLEDGTEKQMSYEQSWGQILCNHTQFRCRLCPDGTGELADISCGDPWYMKSESNDAGWSLVIARTERGKEVIEKAVAEGKVELTKVEYDLLPKSQVWLNRKRRHLWARLLALRLFCVPVPKFEGFYLWRNWVRVTFKEKLVSFFGTVKRILVRKLFMPMNSCRKQSDGQKRIRVRRFKNL